MTFEQLATLVADFTNAVWHMLDNSETSGPIDEPVTTIEEHDLQAVLGFLDVIDGLPSGSPEHMNAGDLLAANLQAEITRLPDHLALVAAAYRDVVRNILGVTILVAPDGISHREGAESVRRQLAGFIETLTPADAEAHLTALLRAEYERGKAETLGNLPADFAVLVVEAMAEAEKAMIKFTQPNYVISKFAEEAGEVVKAAIHHAENRETRDAVVGEMRQVLAMMLRLWIEGDQVHGMKPLTLLTQEGR